MLTNLGNNQDTGNVFMTDSAIGSAIRSTRTLCAGSALLLALTSIGNAADAPASGPYVRASAVESSLKSNGIGAVLPPDQFFALAEHYGDEQATGWSIAAGWRLQRHVAVEAGYVDFGERTLKSAYEPVIGYSNTPASQTFTILHGGTEIEIDAMYVAIIGSWPLGNWEPYVKVGALKMDTSVDIGTLATETYFYPRSGVASVTPGKVAADDSTLEVLTAIGVTYTIAGHYDVTLEAARIPDVGGTRTTGEGDLTSLALGIGYRF
jgi:hypothetical protein